MGEIRQGFVAPFVDEREFVELARLGEARGWEVIFTWEAVYRHDAWATLAAASSVTERIRLGTLLTPVSRYRPWDLAARVGTLDRLSAGRAVLGGGLGAPTGNWTAFEPDDGRRLRRERMDEVLDIYAGLMAGQPFSYAGRHFQVSPVTEIDPLPPLTTPHPPVWLVGALVPGRSAQPSVDRAARWEGVFPTVVGADGKFGLTLAALTEIVERIRTVRQAEGMPWEGYEVCVEADSYGGFGNISGPAQPWIDAGATLWVESWWDLPDSPEGVAEVFARVDAGPRW